MLRALPKDNTFSIIERYRDLDRQIKVLEKEKKELNDELKSGYFLDHKDFIVDGRILMQCLNIIQVRLDQARIEKELPDVFKEFQTIIEFKQLRLK